MRTPQRFFAMFGQRASGKTVYIATLYGSSRNQADEGLEYHIEAAGDETHIYLRQAFERLLFGSWPDATPFDSRQTGQKMDLRLTVHGRAYQVRLPDIGGDLTRRLHTEADRDTMPDPDLKARILQELADYQGFLLFVPADSIEGAQGVEYKWEVRPPSGLAQEQDAGWRRGFPAGGGHRLEVGPAGAVPRWRSRSRGESPRVLRVDVSGARLGAPATCKNVRVFPVSATGPLDQGFLRADRPVQPRRSVGLAP